MPESSKRSERGVLEFAGMFLVTNSKIVLGNFIEIRKAGQLEKQAGSFQRTQIPSHHSCIRDIPPADLVGVSDQRSVRPVS